MVAPVTSHARPAVTLHRQRASRTACRARILHTFSRLRTPTGPGRVPPPRPPPRPLPLFGSSGYPWCSWPSLRWSPFIKYIVCIYILIMYMYFMRTIEVNHVYTFNVMHITTFFYTKSLVSFFYCNIRLLPTNPSSRTCSKSASNCFSNLSSNSNPSKLLSNFSSRSHASFFACKTVSLFFILVSVNVFNRSSSSMSLSLSSNSSKAREEEGRKAQARKRTRKTERSFALERRMRIESCACACVCARVCVRVNVSTRKRAFLRLFLTTNRSHSPPLEVVFLCFGLGERNNNARVCKTCS